MKQRGIIDIVLALLLVVAATRAHAAQVFRYKYHEGQVDAYAAKNASQEVLTTAGEGSQRFATDGQASISFRTLAVDKLGVAQRDVTVDRMTMTRTVAGRQAQIVDEGGSVAVTLDGQPFTPPPGEEAPSVSGKPIRLKIDGRGHVLEVDFGSLRAVYEGADPSVFEEIVFPEAPISVKQTWSGETKSSVDMMGMKVVVPTRYTYTLVGFEQYKGGKVARIKVKGSGEVSGESVSQPFKRLGRAVTEYELFDYDTGRTALVESHEDVVLTMVRGDGRAQTLRRTSDTKVIVQ